MTIAEFLVWERCQVFEALEEAIPSSMNSRKTGTATLYSTVCNLHLFPYFTGNSSKKERPLTRAIVPILREILKPQPWAMVKYYLTHGAATIWILRYNLGVSKSRAYNWHKLLEESGIVEPKTTIKPVGKMKRPTTIWGIPGATEAQIYAAYQTHLNLASPIYRKARILSKRYIENGGSLKVTLKDLIFYLKSIDVLPRMRHDLAKMMLPMILGKKGD